MMALKIKIKKFNCHYFSHRYKRNKIVFPFHKHCSAKIATVVIAQCKDSNLTVVMGRRAETKV